MIYTIVWSNTHVVRASFSTVLLSLLSAGAQTEMKRVVGDNATLPCHHQFWQSNGQTLDIEWLLQKPNVKQRVVRNILFLCPLIIFLVFTHCLLFILFQFHLDFVLWTFVFASVLLISFQSSHLTVYLWGDFNFTETSQWIHFGFVSVNVLFPISWRTFPAKWLAMQFVQGNVVKTQVILYLDSSL